jgi:hypothetical protein
MEELNLSGFSNISSDQNSGFLDDEDKFFRGNSVDSNSSYRSDAHWQEEKKVVEYTEETKNIDENANNHNLDGNKNNKEKIDDEVAKNFELNKLNRSKSEYHRMNIIARKIVVDPENWINNAENQWSQQNDENECVVVKLFRPWKIGSQKSWIRPSTGEILLKKTESEVVKDKDLELKEVVEIDANNHSNGRNRTARANSEDLGVLIPLFDWIFWVSNQKVVIQKLLNDSLHKRVNQVKNRDYGIYTHYLIASFLQYKIISWENREDSSIVQEICSEPWNGNTNKDESIQTCFSKIAKQSSLSVPPISIERFLEKHKHILSK